MNICKLKITAIFSNGSLNIFYKPLSKNNKLFNIYEKDNKSLKFNNKQKSLVEIKSNSSLKYRKKYIK